MGTGVSPRRIDTRNFYLIGDEGIRTPDPLLARQVLSQLSYTPISLILFCIKVGLRRLELPTSRLSGVRSNRLSYKPLGLSLLNLLGLYISCFL